LRLRLLLLAGVLASHFIVGPIAETSAGPGYPTVVTIGGFKGGFHGRVHLRRAGQHPKIAKPCRTRRRVALFWHHNGNTQRVGVDRTSRLGRWSVNTKAHQGRYFAEAKRRILPKAGHKVCERGVSPRVHIG
jgi:hypothetical protein